MQLAAEPCWGERTSAVLTILTALFLTFGVPILIKMDNGSALRSGDTKALLDEHGVIALFSPPRYPQYNGTCERSGGTLKARIEHLALIRGRPGRWTYADVCGGLRLTNTTPRAWDKVASIPAEVFANRRRITRSERRAFHRCVAKKREEALATFQSKFGTMPTCSERKAIGRKAVQSALLEGGYLQFRRGRLSTPIQTWKAVIKA